jgi:hypothetical protein
MSHPSCSTRPLSPFLKITVFLAATLGMAVSLSGTGYSAPSEATSNAPIAFVYVSYTPTGSSSNKVAAFTAAANGRLTTVPGSPFIANVNSMAVNGKYFFGSNMAGVYVASFRILPNGALHWVNSTNVAQYEPGGCVYPMQLVLDHTGTTLYRMQITGGLCEDSEFQSFTVDKPTGRLMYIGKSAEKFLFNTPLTFSGNNKFAYGSECIYYRTGYLDTTSGLLRHTDGLLDYGSISISTPAAQNSGDQYCRSYVAADPVNHVAMAMQPVNINLEQFDGPAQLATYNADASGNLTTTSTWANMPATDAGYVSNLNMSPSGKLLAVGGDAGLQVFHFNGASPITHDTGLLTGDPISQMFWDNNNHLYGLSPSAGKLHVFTVTPTSAAEAPGSPYTIVSPAQIIVQPRTDSDGDWDHD